MAVVAVVQATVVALTKVLKELEEVKSAVAGKVFDSNLLLLLF